VNGLDMKIAVMQSFAIQLYAIQYAISGYVPVKSGTRILKNTLLLNTVRMALVALMPGRPSPRCFTEGQTR